MKTRWAAFVQECCRIPRFVMTISNFALACSILFAAMGIAEAATQNTTLTISGQNNVVISGLTISTTSGDCIDIVNSTNVTIQASQIGPCGTNNNLAKSLGVSVSGSSSVNIYDNYIHVENLASGCCDSHDNILVQGSTGVAIQGNVLAYGESNIEINGPANNQISVIGNFFLNPRGPFPRGQNVQSWGASAQSPNTNITVSNNYALSSQTGYLYPEVQEDSINFGYTNGFTAQNNYVTGGHSASGCGIIADEAANSGNILSNILSNTGQCGIGIASGTNHLVDHNKILNLNPVSGAGDTALYIWSQYAEACGPVTVSNNIADELKTDMATHSGYWNGGGCGTPTLTNDTFNQAAYSLLNPIATTNPAPLIPPLPYSCVAASPYSTQTSQPSCSGSGSGAGTGSGSGSGSGSASPPTATLTASPTSISAGQSSQLTWSSTNATSCKGAGFTAAAVSGSATVAPASTSTYSVTCSGTGGSASASAAVSVALRHGHHH